jgi:hypothetical protein
MRWPFADSYHLDAINVGNFYSCRFGVCDPRVASVPLKIWSYNHNSASYAMDIVIAYLAVFRLTPGYAHQRFFLRHPIPPLPCLCNRILSVASEIPSRMLRNRQTDLLGGLELITSSNFSGASLSLRHLSFLPTV